MRPEQIEQAIREYVRREPFGPFIVELLDGRRIEVSHRGLALGGGGASFISPAYDLVEFQFDQVRSLKLVTTEVEA